MKHKQKANESFTFPDMDRLAPHPNVAYYCSYYILFSALKVFILL